MWFTSPPDAAVPGTFLFFLIDQHLSISTDILVDLTHRKTRSTIPYLHRYIGLLCEVLEWQKAHGLTNKENSLAIKCESPHSPTQTLRRRCKRPFYSNDDDCPKPKIFLENTSEYQKFGNEENEEASVRRFQNRLVQSKMDQVRFLRSQYFFPPRWRHPLPLRSLAAERNGNNLLMIAPGNSKGDVGKKGCQDKDGKDGHCK